MKKASTAFAVLCGITILWFYPVLMNFDTHIAGWGDDSYMFLWNFWWMKESLSTAACPLFCPFILYPLGGSLVFHTFSPFVCLVSVGLQFITNLPAAYNALFLLTFIISGSGAYCLAFRLTKKFLPSLFAGFIFAFCPYRTAHGLGHMNLLNTQWLPFFFLCLFEIIRRTSLPLEKQSGYFKRGSLPYAFAAGIFLLLTAYSSYYYAVYALYGFAIFILYFIIINGRLYWKPLKRSLIAPILFIFGFIPILLPAFQQMKEDSQFQKPPLSDSARWSADLLSWFVFSPIHPVFGKRPAELDLSYSWDERSIPLEDWTAYIQYGSPCGKFTFNFSGHPHEWVHHIGLTPFFIVILFAHPWKKSSVKHRNFWWILLVFSFLLALGPYLHINGRENFSLFGKSLKVPLPFILFYKIPLAGAARMPGRFSILVVLSLSVLAATGLSEWMKRSRLTVASQNFIILGIFLLTAFEFMVQPYPVSDAGIPGIYRHIESAGAEGTVLDVPLGWRTGNYSDPYERTVFQYYQSAHENPILTGHLSRIPWKTIQYFHNIPLVSYLTEPEKYSMPSEKKVRETLQFFNVKWIVLHQKAKFHGINSPLLREKTIARLKKQLDELPGLKKRKTESEHIAAWKCEQMPGEKMVRFGTPHANKNLAPGWGKRYPEAKNPFVVGEKIEQTVFFRPENETKTLEIEISPFHWDGLMPENIELDLALNDKNLGRIRLDSPVPVRRNFRPEALIPLKINELVIRNARKRTKFIGSTGVETPVQITVRSGKINDEYRADILFAGSILSAPCSGLFIVSLDQDEGTLLDRGLIPFTRDDSGDYLITYTENMPGNSIIAASVAGSPEQHEAGIIIQGLDAAGGPAMLKMNAEEGLAFIGATGAAENSAVINVGSPAVICHVNRPDVEVNAPFFLHILALH